MVLPCSHAITQLQLLCTALRIHGRPSDGVTGVGLKRTASNISATSAAALSDSALDGDDMGGDGGSGREGTAAVKGTGRDVSYSSLHGVAKLLAASLGVLSVCLAVEMM